MMHQCLLSARQLQPIKHESDCKKTVAANRPPGEWGDNEKSLAREPVDFVLMPPIHGIVICRVYKHLKIP